MGTQFVGQTRYSLYIPDSRAWRATSHSGEKNDYREYLFAPERMDFRDKLFNEFTVPSIAEAAKKHNLIHIVSYSESLPGKYKESLESTAEQYPFIRLQMLPDGAHDWGHVDKIIKECLEPGVFGRYRLDDDDILSTYYFAEMKKFIKPEFVGMAVSMPLGVEAIFDAGHFYNFRESHLPMNSMGLLYVSELTKDGKIRAARAGAHDRSDRLAPVILNSMKLGYFRTNHTGQDNLLRHSERDVVERLLFDMDRFPAIKNVASLKKSFPAVADKILNTADAAKIEWNQSLGDGIELTLDKPSRGISVVMTGKATKELRKHPVALSLSLTSKSGRLVASRARFTGLATSANASVGQFVYFDFDAGDFEASASAFLPEGVYISAVRIIPLVDGARNVLVKDLTVDCSSGRLSATAVSSKMARRLSRSQRLRRKLATLGGRYRSLIQPKLVTILGSNRSERVLKTIAAKLK
ncbi:putative rhamnosyl transferase [Corynebacterium hadale]|uniref:glycosyltransferase n=1 Tax=Corynebacterium hadale TaxID=2026255 RepID=UPI001EF3283A|nr:glycosyltransferase [Corynebacterium hadale]MCG7255292.1 putative rhamnosyl transferase [Corynebacterium hadale]MCG7257600.1 putative rhamnosyl transferase [Corynebacterium hadale]MCG7266331.1 putative rhamnosyl transferase [Corynebacterium hadale]